MKIKVYWSAIALCTLPFFTNAQTMPEPLQATQLDWRIVNDGVMGGLSQSQMQQTPEGHARFSGTVSLENNGGFASTRATVPNGMRQGIQSIRLRVKGDGQRYSLRLRPAGRYGRVSYRAFFDTKAGEWQELEFPLSDFTPTFRGRVLTDVPPVSGQELEEIGLLIADKQEGQFGILIDWISAER